MPYALHLVRCVVVMMDCWLCDALATIEAGGAVGRQRRRLEEVAFRTSRLAVPAVNGAQPQGSTDLQLLSYEALLRAAGQALGLEGKAAVTQVKLELRRRGLKELAGRVGRASGSRNRVAHPEALALLKDEVVEALKHPAPSCGD